MGQGWGWGLLHTCAVTVCNGGKVRGQRRHAEGLLFGVWMVAEDQQISQLVTICLLLKAGKMIGQEAYAVGKRVVDKIFKSLYGVALQCKALIIWYVKTAAGILY